MNNNRKSAQDWHSSTGGKLDKAMSPVENTANIIAGFAIFGLMLLGTAQIILRSVFNSPIAGYIDMVELSMAGMAFLGAAYCQRLGAHVRMEILIGFLRGRMLWVVEALAILVALFIVGVLVWYSLGHFERAYSLGDTTIDAEFPVWPSKLIVPIGFSLWFIRLFVQFLAAVRLIIDPSLKPMGIIPIQAVSTVANDEVRETFGEHVDTMPDGNSQDESSR